MQLFALPVRSVLTGLKSPPSRGTGTPPWTLKEERHAINLIFSMGAVPPHSLSVHLRDGVLTVSGLRPASAVGRDRSAYERFTFRHVLPALARRTSPDISLCHGELLIRISK